MSDDDGMMRGGEDLQSAIVGALGGTLLKSRQQQIIDAAIKLGRHLYCPYCDSRTVAPVAEEFRFSCTLCDAAWDTDGVEVQGPKPTSQRGCQACGHNTTVAVPGFALRECPVCRARYLPSGARAICPKHLNACKCFEGTRERVDAARGQRPVEPGERFIDLGEDESSG